MIDIKIFYENGDITSTGINATFKEAKRYYVGKWFNLGSVEDNMQKCERIELILPMKRDILFQKDADLLKALTDTGLCKFETNVNHDWIVKCEDNRTTMEFLQAVCKEHMKSIPGREDYKLFFVNENNYTDGLVF